VEQERKAQDEQKKLEDERRIAELAKRAPATNYNELYKRLFHKVIRLACTPSHAAQQERDA
jgi:hypothetical protein